MKKKDNNKLIIAIAAVLLIIAIVGGSTFAYWSWQTATNQQTSVSVTIKGGSLNITGTNVTSVGMYPTKDCDGAAALVGTATVTAKNETATDMLVTLKLRGTITSSQGTLNSTNKAYLKWAVVETTSALGLSAADNACDTATYNGTLANVTTSTDFDTGITFTAYRNDLTTTELNSHKETTINSGVATTVRTYKVYVWLDETYPYENTGNTVTDPMQDLSISVKWSPASTMTQQ